MPQTMATNQLPDIHQILYNPKQNSKQTQPNILNKPIIKPIVTNGKSTATNHNHNDKLTSTNPQRKGGEIRQEKKEKETVMGKKERRGLRRKKKRKKEERKSERRERHGLEKKKERRKREKKESQREERKK